MRALIRLLLLGLVVASASHVAVTAARAKDWPGKVPSKSERGEELWDRHCVACHGPQAKGDGPLAAALVAQVPDLSMGLPGRDRKELVQLVLRGRGAHPAFEQSFRDLKPFQADVRDYAEGVLDHMERVGQRAVEAEAPEVPAEGDEAEEDQDQGPRE
ncbi:MAG: c-type cytochrome [Alphaproteobacteria bacterium]|nr:c-type cytochrome [Alphaproteobacteria bacterium]